MNVERMRSQSARADVKHNRQPLARNRVKHFLHQHETLARSEIRHAPAREREAFACGRGRMFGFGLDKRERVAPQVLFAVGDFGFVARAHRRRGRDGVRARAVSDVDFDPDDAGGAVTGGWDSGEGNGLVFVGHKKVDLINWDAGKLTGTKGVESCGRGGRAPAGWATDCSIILDARSPRLFGRAEARLDESRFVVEQPQEV